MTEDGGEVINLEEKRRKLRDDGGGGGDWRLEIVERLVRVETRMESLATREDLEKAIAGVKIWVLVGTLIAILSIAGLVFGGLEVLLPRP